MDLEKIGKMSDALTERDLVESRHEWHTILNKYPEGFTMLSHAEKIPGEKILYNIQLSRPVGELILCMRQKYNDPDLAAAVVSRLVGELLKQNEKI